MSELFTTRREMMAVPLFAAAFAMFRAESVKAAGVDPTMTMITPPDQPGRSSTIFPRAPPRLSRYQLRPLWRWGQDPKVVHVLTFHGLGPGRALRRGRLPPCMGRVLCPGDSVHSTREPSRGRATKKGVPLRARPMRIAARHYPSNRACS
jgi:hypothetical protein